MKFKSASGTRDFFPEDMESRNKVFNSMRSVCNKYGFSEVESPIFENFSLLKAKSGPEIKEQLFTLDKRGNEELALRPEFTVALARMFIDKQKVLQKPVKWFGIGKCFRYERPQKGRLREFYQLSAELYGAPGPIADAESISLAIDCLRSLGLKKENFVVKINSRSLLETVLKGLGIKKEAYEVFRAIDKRLKISPESFEEELKKAGLTKDQSDKLIKILNENDLSKLEGADDLKQVFNYLEKLGKKDFIEFDLSIARGLAYYTGTVFECFDRKGELRAVFAGGRYDTMIEQLGGQKCPVTGFAIGDVTTQLLLEKNNLWPKAEKGIDYFVAPMDEKAVPFALEVIKKLREKNSAVIDLIGKKLDKQLSYASSINAKNAVIIGDEEVKDKALTIKDLSTGKQIKKKLNEI